MKVQTYVTRSSRFALMFALAVGCTSNREASTRGRDRCPVHGDVLLDDNVPMVEGGGPMDTVPPNLGPPVLPGEWQPEYEWEAEPKEFPFAHVVKRSGCSWDPRMEGTLIHVVYCPSCRESRRNWRLAHPGFVRPDNHAPHGELIEGDHIGESE